MICENCGHYLPDGETQCFHCGAVQNGDGKPARHGRAKHDAGGGRQGPSVRNLLVVLIVLAIAALVIWYMVYATNKPDSDTGEGQVSSQEVSSMITPQVTGDWIGQTDVADLILVDQKEIYLCSRTTGEAELVCGLTDKGVRILSAAYCNNFIYFVECSDSYQYLYRVSPSAGAQVEKLRLNDQGNQMRTQIEQLMAVNGKLCGFARYPRVEGTSEAYVELYQLNADGVYRASDTSTKILYTTQNSAEEKDKDLAKYTVSAGDTTLSVFYDGDLVAECEVG